MRVRRKVFLWRMRHRTGAHRLAAFGPNSLIEPPATLLSPHRIEIGDNVLLHRDAFLSVVEEHNGRRYDPHLRIGRGTNFGRNLWVSCVGSIDIGEEVLAGHNVLITDTYHSYEDPDVSIVRQPMAPPRAVVIGDGCILGPHVAVLAGVTIGARSFVSAGAVVTKSVPPNSVVVGNPARVLRWFDRSRGEWVDGEPPAEP